MKWWERERDFFWKHFLINWTLSETILFQSNLEVNPVESSLEENDFRFRTDWNFSFLYTFLLYLTLYYFFRLSLSFSCLFMSKYRKRKGKREWPFEWDYNPNSFSLSSRSKSDNEWIQFQTFCSCSLEPKPGRNQNRTGLWKPGQLARTVWPARIPSLSFCKKHREEFTLKFRQERETRKK